MSTTNPPTWQHPRWISYALIVIALVATLVGVADPQTSSPTRRTEAEEANVIAQDRADEHAGFPLPPHPDDPPRGPGP